MFYLIHQLAPRSRKALLDLPEAAETHDCNFAAKMAAMLAGRLDT
jgi:hypothetical protein